MEPVDSASKHTPHLASTQPPTLTSTQPPTLTSTLTQAERGEYLTFDRVRRRRLLGAIVPFGMALSSVAVAVATVALFVTPHLDASVWINDAVTLGLAVLFATAWLAIRADELDVASGLVIGAGCGGILVTVGIAAFSQGLSPLTFVQVASLTIIVVVVGMLGGLRAIVAVTLLLNASTVAILLWAPHPIAVDALIREQFPLLLSVSLTYQWGVAALMIATWRSYRQTLQSLGVAYERAQQLDNLKAQFITHVNHELRTPIMTLQGYIEYLRLGRESLPDDEIDAALARASRTADTLVTLLSNILDIRRIETQSAFAPERVRVRDALDAALALIDPRLSDGAPRDLHLELPDDLEIWGDRLRLQQILTNLLANALKYSPPGSPLEVSGFVLRSDPRLQRGHGLARRGKVPAPGMVEIVVRDHGYGIPPDQAPLLFNRFARLPRDLASKVEGTGLGLYLCRVFAEAMRGSIWVESSGVKGEGSAFHIRLPAPPDQQVAGTDEAHAGHPHAGHPHAGHPDAQSAPTTSPRGPQALVETDLM